MSRDWLVLPLTVLMLASCQADSVPTPDADISVSEPDTSSIDIPVFPTETYAPGLRILGRARQPVTPRQAGHLNEIIVEGERVYVANSTDLVASYLIGADEDIDWIYDAARPEEGFHCQTIAYHSSSGTLLCREAVQAIRPILRLSTANPDGAILINEPGQPADGRYVRDLEVIGDDLFMAAIEDGLLRATISPSGTVGAFEPTGLSTGPVHQVVGDSERLVWLERSGGPVVADVQGGLMRRASLTLDGPPVDVALDGERIAVALGSQGVVVVTDGGVELTQSVEVRPQCVTSAVDLYGDLLAVGCLSGIYVYDIGASPPRLAGFEPSLGIITDLVATSETRLVVADWEYMHHYAVDLEGDVVMVDRPRGVYIVQGDDAQVVLRNEGQRRLTGELVVYARVEGRTTWDGRPLEEERRLGFFDLEGGESAAIVVSASDIVDTMDARGQVDAELVVHQAGNAIQGYAHLEKVLIVQRSNSLDPALGHPAQGDLFPPLIAGDLEDEEVALPEDSGVPRRLVFTQVSCEGMWVEAFDLEHLRATNALPDAAQTLMIYDRQPQYVADFVRAWGLDGLPCYTTGGSHAALVLPDGGREQGEGEKLYEDYFHLIDIPGGAMHPTDYILDEAGRVSRIERVYRGPYPLIVSTPPSP